MMTKLTAQGFVLVGAALLNLSFSARAQHLIVPPLQMAVTPTNTVYLSWQGVLPCALQESLSLALGTWVTVTNMQPKTNQSSYGLILPKQTTSRFYRLVFDGIAQLETRGSSFSARVDSNSNALQSLRWTWSDGSNATNRPVASKTFNGSGIRLHSLTAAPAGAITAINLGFDGADSGWTNQIASFPPQNVSAVNFASPLTNLQLWASSYNPLTNLDFSGFNALQSIDCYQCLNLTRAVITNLPSLRRACLETCNLAELDLYGAANLEELRVAGNRFNTIGLGGGVGPKVWHWCTRDNQLTQQIAESLTNFYSLQDFYVWNNNQSGSLTLVSTNLMDVNAYSNSYTYADFSGHSKLWRCLIFRNNLTNLVIDGCSSLQALDASYNKLPTAAVDAILRQLDTNAPALGYVNLKGNAGPPSVLGYNYYSRLTNRGVVVQVDGR
jgi:hypothetical protein